MLLRLFLLLLVSVALTATSAASDRPVEVVWANPTIDIHGQPGERLVLLYTVHNRDAGNLHGLITQAWTPLGPTRQPERIVHALEKGQALQRELHIELAVGMTRLCLDIEPLTDPPWTLEPLRVCRPIQLGRKRSNPDTKLQR